MGLTPEQELTWQLEEISQEWIDSHKALKLDYNDEDKFLAYANLRMALWTGVGLGESDTPLAKRVFRYMRFLPEVENG